MDTKLLDFSNYLFRSSSASVLLSNPVGKSPFDEWQDYKNEKEPAKEKLFASLAETEEKIKNWPIEKQTQAGYKALITKKEKLNSEIAEKIPVINSRLKELEEKKDTIRLSETCIKHLISIYNFVKHKRKQELNNRYINKGNKVEEKSITLLSTIHKDFYVKNKIRVYDDFIQGECDIETKTKIIDAKSSWSIHTFQSKTVEKRDPSYFGQGQCYMHLYKKHLYGLCYVLIDTPQSLIEDEKTRLLYKLGTDKRETDLYIKACEEIERENTYSDIDKLERLIEDNFDFEPSYIVRLRKRIVECREWLNNYAKSEYLRCYGREFSGEFISVTGLENYDSKFLRYREYDSEFDKVYIEFEEITEEEPVRIPAIAAKPEFEQPAQSSETIVNSQSEPETNPEPETKTEPELITPETPTSTVQIQAPEPNKEFVKIFEKINACDTSDSLIVLYKEIKKDWVDVYPEIKQAMTIKKESFKVEEKKPDPVPVKENKEKTIKIKPLAEVIEEPKKPEIPSIPSEDVNTNLINEIQIKADNCKTPEEVRALYKENLLLIQSNPALRKYVGKRGEALETEMKSKAITSDDL